MYSTPFYTIPPGDITLETNILCPPKSTPGSFPPRLERITPRGGKHQMDDLPCHKGFVF